MPEKCLICYESEGHFCQKDQYGRIQMDEFLEMEFIPITIEECPVYRIFKQPQYIEFI